MIVLFEPLVVRAVNSVMENGVSLMDHHSCTQAAWGKHRNEAKNSDIARFENTGPGKVDRRMSLVFHYFPGQSRPSWRSAFVHEEAVFGASGYEQSTERLFRNVPVLKKVRPDLNFSDRIFISSDTNEKFKLETIVQFDAREHRRGRFGSGVNYQRQDYLPRNS